MHQIDEVLDRSAKAIELPNYKRVTRAKHVESCIQARAIFSPPTGMILKHAHNPGPLERIALQA